MCEGFPYRTGWISSPKRQGDDGKRGPVPPTSCTSTEQSPVRVRRANADAASTSDNRMIGLEKGTVTFPLPVLGVAEGLFGSHYRISFTTAHISYPGNQRGKLHADWPFNQHNAGNIPAPYPDAVQHLTTLWMLSPFTEETGATIIVPGSHRHPNNPTGDIGVDPWRPSPARSGPPATPAACSSSTAGSGTPSPTTGAIGPGWAWPCATRPSC